MTTPTPAQPEHAAGTCCGGGMSWQPKTGEPLIHSCQLCKASPTYWARERPTDRQEARLG